MTTAPARFLISAIVSTYDAERLIGGKLADLEAQTIADRLEIIVIDSGSTQDEGAVVREFQKRYANIRYLRTERRETVYQAWNRGIRMARGEFVTNANTDDRLAPNALQVLCDALQNNPEAVLAYADMYVTENEDEIFTTHVPHQSREWPEFDRLALVEDCFVGPFPLWRRSLHDAIGYFDERFKSAADYEFWLRAALRHPFVHVPQHLGLYFISKNTVSRNGHLPTLEYLLVQKMYRPKYALFAPPPPQLPLHAEEEYRRLISLAQQNPHLALPQLERFVERHDSPRARHQLAELCLGVQKVGPALQHFKRAALLEPANPLYAEKLQAFLQGELADAVEYFTGAVAEDPADIDSLLTLGLICQFLDRFGEARGHYLRVLELDPESALARGNLAALSAQEEKACAPRGKGGWPEQPEAPHHHTPVPAQDLVSIVIPTRNGIACTRQCVESIGKHTAHPHEVIFVDSGSSDGTVEWLRELCRERGGYRLLEDGDHVPFAVACQRGIAAATGSYLLLLKNDTVVTAGWLAGMLAHLRRDGKIGIIAPMRNAGGAPQEVAAVRYGSIEELEGYARAFRSAHLDRRVEADTLSDFCLLLPRCVLQAVKELLAEGKLEDVCLAVRLAGYRSVIAGDVFIHHYGACPDPLPKGPRTVNVAGLEECLAKKVVTDGAMVRGRRLAQQGRPGEAVDLLLQEGIRFSPEHPAPYLLLAELLADGGRAADALDVLKNLPAGGELSRALLEARCRLMLGEIPAARRAVEAASAVEKGDAAVLHLQGEVAWRCGDAAEAERLATEALRVDAGYAPPYRILARLHAEKGMREKALVLAERGYMLAPQDLEALALFDELAVLQGALRRVEERVREARALLPFNRGIHFALIDLLLRKEDAAGAMEEIERAAVAFGTSDGMLDAALAVRRRLGPRLPQRAGRPTLSLCMIVKNEAQHLPRVLMSVMALVDEMVVVDTGSSDRSADIATVFGARVFRFPWTGSFAEARNHSLTQAGGDWILVLDADEALAHRDLERIAGLLTGQKAGYLMTTRNYTDSVTRRRWSANSGEYPQEEAGCGWTPSEKVRLFPRHAAVRFEGAVHELVEDSLLALEIPILPCPVPVHHYGRLDTVREKEKRLHYYQLGMRKLTQEEGDIKALIELAIQATELERFAEAQELWERVLKPEPKNREAFFNLGYIYLSTGRYHEALRFSHRACELDPQLKEAAFNAGKAELYLGFTAQALHTAQQILGKCPGYPPALALLCTALLLLDRTQEAEELLAELRQRGFDCADFLREHAAGVQKGAHPALAATLLSKAGDLSGGGQSLCADTAQQQ